MFFLLFSIGDKPYRHIHALGKKVIKISFVFNLIIPRLFA